MIACNKMKKIVLCDFDGTLIEGNLENTFLHYLLKGTSYRWIIIAISFFTLPINLILNKFGFPSIFKSWTFVLKNNKKRIIHSFLSSDFFSNSPKMKYREDVLEMLSLMRYDRMIILTGSDEELVTAFLNKYKIIKFDEIIGSQVKDDLFRVKRHPFGKGKIRYVNRDYYNIGIANDYSDHFYLEICNEKYYV